MKIEPNLLENFQLWGSDKFNWYIFDFFNHYYFPKMLFFYSLYFYEYVCKFSGQSDFFAGKINKIKSYYDLRRTLFLAKMRFLHRIVCLFIY